MDEYKNALILLLNRAKEQLTENEYTKLLEFVRKIVK